MGTVIFFEGAECRGIADVTEKAADYFDSKCLHRLDTDTAALARWIMECVPECARSDNDSCTDRILGSKFAGDRYSRWDVIKAIRSAE